MKGSVIAEIRQDLDELDFLCKEYKKSLLQFQKQLVKLKTHPAFPFLAKEAERLLEYLYDLQRQIAKSHSQINTASPKRLEELAHEKRKLFMQLRSCIPFVTSLVTSSDWQSPSFMHSLNSEAGIQEGDIIAHINDYKRDRHLNEERYQEQFLKEYVDGFKFPIGAYLTSSGMAALTTIITFLILQKKIKGPVLVGRSIYFENTEIMQNFFKKEKVLKVDEMNTEKILEVYDKNQPDLLLFDSLCNAPTVAVPDIPTILKYVALHAKKETFFIIDNSTLSIALQPLKILRLPSKVKLIVFESLNKYHQFGLDRVTAGIVWYRGSGFEKFYQARVHAGTNIPDNSVYALPTPNRKHLEARLSRHNRNAKYLSEALSTFIYERDLKKIEGIVYPGLVDHPSYAWVKKFSFQGSYFVISFKKPYQKVRVYQRFVKQVIENARKKKVAIVGGTSFGFNTTRIYLTAQNTDYGQPFIRVSLGTENLGKLEKIKEVFIDTIKSF